MAESRPLGEIVLERRQSSRIPFEAKATLECEGQFLSGVTLNLTPGGAFLVVCAELPLAARLDMTFDLGDGASALEVQGRVVRVESDAFSINGFAVEFDRIEHDDAERIVAATCPS